MTTQPWHAHYDVGVPRTLVPYPDRTLLDYLTESATTHSGSPAILFKGNTISYGQVETLSDRFAAALQALGVARGDRVGLLLPNCPQFVIAELAAWKLGAIVAPLNPIYTESELEGPIRENGIDTVVTLTRFYTRIRNIHARTPIKRIIATNIKEFFPPALRLLFTLFREKRDGDRVKLAKGDHDFARLIAQSPGPPRRAAVDVADPAVLLMSGGTTGAPKGVQGTHGAYTISGVQIQAWMAPVSAPGDVILLPLPLFHVYGNVGVQSFALVTGNPLALVPNPRDLNDVIATIRKVSPAFFNGVPTLYTALLNHPAVIGGKVDFKSIKVCFSGASPLLAETKQRFEAMTNGRIVEGYSLTEAMMALCINPVKGANKIGSVGLPLPDVEVRIFDQDEGVTAQPPGEIGEICFSALQLMTGFWNQPEETQLVLREHTEDGSSRVWLHTGDLGYFDSDGYLFIVDRKKDLIKTSGYQVWPREIEEVLAAHPAVAEVGVAGVPDALKGEGVRAWIVLRHGHAADEATLRAFCRERLAPYKVPGRIEFRKELPKTMVGKVLRRALRESAGT